VDLVKIRRSIFLKRVQEWDEGQQAPGVVYFASQLSSPSFLPRPAAHQCNEAWMISVSSVPFPPFHSYKDVLMCETGFPDFPPRLFLIVLLRVAKRLCSFSFVPFAWFAKVAINSEKITLSPTPLRCLLWGSSSPSCHYPQTENCFLDPLRRQSINFDLVRWRVPNHLPLNFRKSYFLAHIFLF
jgi:hypothetical protein